MNQCTLIFASIFGLLSIILGAFGAHKLKKIMNSELLISFETGVKYQMYHALVLLILGFNLDFKTPLENWIVYCFIIGTILFSFSIYGLTISAAKNKKIKFLGPITPIGGLFLVSGWGLLLYYFTVTSF
ncbi:MAG: DUF423 domain-containing protein [Flavobacteriaceae bacterium]|nr:DUF423 domain-containing protein [Flavobacteriaceae bacterium]